MAAITNYTGDGEWQTLPELFCSAELTEGIHSQLIRLSVLIIFLSITAFLGNTLILAALYKETSLHPPSKLLLRTDLATTDLCVGIIVEPFHVIYLMSVVNKQWNTCRFSVFTVFITGQILRLVSLLTMTTISVDRLLALLLGLRYRQVVTLARIHVAVTVFWALSIIGCVRYFWNESLVIIFSYIYIILTLCFLISIYSYTRIFLRLRHRQSQVTGQPNQTTPLNIARYRKAASSALWLQLTLVVFYLPYIVVLSFTLSESWFSSPRISVCTKFGLFQLVVKPFCLLLEDQRSETSSEGYIKAAFLFMKGLLRVSRSAPWKVICNAFGIFSV